MNGMKATAVIAAATAGLWVQAASADPVSDVLGALFGTAATTTSQAAQPRVRGRHARRAARAGRAVAAGAGRAAGGSVGYASYYYGGGRRTASGGRVGGDTCAHRTLPFGTRVLVTNLTNLRQALLTVNDRGPFVRGRIIDVSAGGAGRLGMIGSGTARVKVEVYASR